jgi:uncharacterized DUF497 family protein
MLVFGWDERKNRRNRAKHGIWFEEAKTAFEDPRAILVDDPDHSEHEERFLLLGTSSSARLLVVVHCLRDGEGTIRLISARKATKKEGRIYEEGI